MCRDKLRSVKDFSGNINQPSNNLPTVLVIEELTAIMGTIPEPAEAPAAEGVAPDTVGEKGVVNGKTVLLSDELENRTAVAWETLQGARRSLALASETHRTEVTQHQNRLDTSEKAVQQLRKPDMQRIQQEIKEHKASIERETFGLEQARLYYLNCERILLAECETAEHLRARKTLVFAWKEYNTEVAQRQSGIVKATEVIQNLRKKPDQFRTRQEIIAHEVCIEDQTSSLEGARTRWSYDERVLMAAVETAFHQHEVAAAAHARELHRMTLHSWTSENLLLRTKDSVNRTETQARRAQLQYKADTKASEMPVEETVWLAELQLGVLLKSP